MHPECLQTDQLYRFHIKKNQNWFDGSPQFIDGKFIRIVIVTKRPPCGTSENVLSAMKTVLGVEVHRHIPPNHYVNTFIPWYIVDSVSKKAAP